MRQKPEILCLWLNFRFLVLANVDYRTEVCFACSKRELVCVCFFFFFRLSKNSFKYCERCLSERFAIQIHQTIRELAVQLPTVKNALHPEAGFCCLLERDKGSRGLQRKNECNQRGLNAFALTAVTGKFRGRISVFVSL